MPQAVPLPELCHVTVVAPRRRADLSLPGDIPLPHVLPGLLRALGEADGEHTSGPGWVLQRVGGAPMDLSQSLGALGVLDGEVLYLRPREAVIPPAMYDDLADVVADGVRDGAGWSREHTRLLGTGVAVVLLVTGAAGLLLSGLPGGPAAVAAGVFALLLLGVAGALSRAMGDSAAGALIGYAALPYGFLTGLFVPAGGDVAGTTGLGAPHLLAAFACGALVATLAGVLVADGVPAFLGTAIAAVTGVAGSAVVMVSGASGAGVAAVAVTILLALSPVIPSLSFKLARMPMPALPTNAEELRNDNQRLDSSGILEQARQAQRYATGVIIGISMTALVAQVCLVLEGGPMALSMSAVVSLVLIIRTRVFAGLGQRLWLTGSGVAGLVMLAAKLASAGGIVPVIAVGIVLFWVAMITLGLSIKPPAGNTSPFWGRAADIIDITLIVALFPLALGVLDLYAWIRGLSG
ncbi:type VII secretion integral membrane protein EccD [Microtetraspora sp. NBRC 13810]|nr:type VII secretion integral membrane protein EccD [Microtetraspora sp. NBRC 13810]